MLMTNNAIYDVKSLVLALPSLKLNVRVFILLCVIAIAHIFTNVQNAAYNKYIKALSLVRPIRS